MPTERFINRIVCGDAGEILKEFDTNSVNMVLTSPPYDNLREYVKGRRFSFEEFKRIAQELKRVLKPGGVIVWITSDATVNCSETCSSFKQALYFVEELGLKLHDTMIFRKLNPVPQIYRKRYLNEFEYTFVFSKGCVKNHNPITVRCKHAGLELKGTTYKNFSRKAQKRGKPAKPVKEYKIKGNVWEYVVGKSKEDQTAKWHPAPFPLALARDHILSWSNPDDLVLDPFCGSGTTCIAAAQLGRKYAGIEINPEYTKLALERLQNLIK